MTTQITPTQGSTNSHAVRVELPPDAVRPRPDTTTRFFFVTGAAKSGTSWVGSMLDGHPEIACIGEAMFVGPDFDVNSWINPDKFRAWSMHPNLTLDWLKGRLFPEIINTAKRAMIESVLMTRWRPGVKWIGDKTPLWYCVGCRPLSKLFPDGLFINVVRDGRDVAVSHAFDILRRGDLHLFGTPELGKRVHDFHVAGTGEPVSLFTPAMTDICVRGWVESVKGAALARTFFGPNYLEVRYEHALADPYNAMLPVFTAMNVNTDETLLRECVEKKSFEKQSGRSRGQADPKSYFRKGVAGDWRNYFDEAAKAQFKERAGQWLIDLGYVPDNNW